MSAIQTSVTIVLKSGINKRNQNALSWFKLMSRDRLSHIYYEIHVPMFPKVATRDCKQYLQQLMIPESLMGVNRKGGSTGSGKSSIFDVSHD